MTGFHEEACGNELHDTHNKNWRRYELVMSDNCAVGRAVFLGVAQKRLCPQAPSLSLSFAPRAPRPSRHLRREIASPC